MDRIYKYGFFILLVLNMTALFTVARDYTAANRSGRISEDTALEQLRHALSLSEAQAREIADNRRMFEYRVTDKRTGLQHLREDLISVMQMQEPDTEKIRQLVDEIASRQVDIEQQAVALYLQERDKLSAAQQETYHRHMSRRMRMGGRGGRWGQLNQDNENGQSRPMRGRRGPRWNW